MASRPAPWVLWAEDDIGDQALISGALAERPAPRVEFVPDGIELLERLRRELPDLVVLDLKMPRMGGLEALRRLRSDPRTAGLAVTVFSSGSVPSEIQEVASLGVREVRQKPIQFGAFTQAVHSILDAVAVAPARRNG